MDIVVWLRSLGLGKYEAAFRENAIDDTVLHDLTEDHLRKIGIPIDQDTLTPEHGCTDGVAGVGVVGAGSVSEIRHSLAAGG